MNDEQIIELYFQRNENAINETQIKYQYYCFSIANRILYNSEDANECVNDAYLAVWNSIPPNKPNLLSTYVGKITRRIAINKLKHRTRKKRGENVASVALDELIDCIPDKKTFDDQIEETIIAKSISDFLRSIKEDERNIFIRRYWYLNSIKEISNGFGFGQSKVKMLLLRTRKKLLTHLEKEGIIL